ncbi:hypothetical protein LPMP_271920 [Leishmania panamensis]|uniref:Transmembrane protein n=1 Tax=Leishmania panamensis TaxID=5679 RepID=A0A088SCY0_LEIPA|nr:hypothetical protein LPMP_271920 [Leishmania panamensis]AIN99571.1 hypothetical protein LPMP_271920 [Leishmania panamensis]
MSSHDTEEVTVFAACILPSGVRYSTLTSDAHQKNHMALGVNGELYLVVHPMYSLSPRVYSRYVLGAVLLVLLEVAVFLLTLLGLSTPFLTKNSRSFFSFAGGSGAFMIDPPERRTPLVVSSAFLVAFLLLFSFICPISVVLCVRRDQHARVSEELFNRELLEQHGVQVRDDGHVCGPGGEPSVAKEEGALDPCCGFEANEHSRLLRNAGMFCVQCGVEVISVIILIAVVSDMRLLHRNTMEQQGAVSFQRGFFITIVALVLKILELILYCYIAYRMLRIRLHQRLPRCHLVPVSSCREVGALATGDGACSSSEPPLKDGIKEGYSGKSCHGPFEREGSREMEPISLPHLQLY